MRLIDADAMRTDWLENGQNEYVYDTNAVLESIDEQPTIEAEPVRHGRWNEDGRCTVCGGHAPYYAMASTYYESPYCFECGAKMDLED